MKRVRWIWIAPLFAGCGLKLGNDIPQGAAALGVAVEGDCGTLRAELSLHEMLSERRVSEVAPSRAAEFARLGPAVYAVRVVAPDGVVVEPPWHYVPLKQGERRTISFRAKRGGVVRLSGLPKPYESTVPPCRVWMPESVLKRPLSQQVLWVLQQGSYQPFFDERTALTVSASAEPLWLIVGGTMLWGYGFSERWSPKSSGSSPEAPMIEGLLLRKIGPIRAGEEKELVLPESPHLFGSDVVLSGRVVDAAAKPIPGAFLVLLPDGEGAGAFVMADEAGRYEIRGLAPRKYRACLVRHEEEVRRERVLELEIPSTPEKRDLTLE